jgi:dUTPase
MKIKYYIKNVDGLNIPVRANESDAGYDVIATSDPKIVGENYSSSLHKRIDYIEYETNVYISPEKKENFDNTKGFLFSNFHTDLRPRSSISKYNLVLANSVGLIDRGYRNMILARFKYLWQPEDYVSEDGKIVGIVNASKIYKKGDKICQLVPMETHDIEFVVVEHLDKNDRGGGFGSTDRPKPTAVINKGFVLGNRTTIGKYFAGHNPAKIEMAKAYYANYQGEIYMYEESGMRGLCVIDASGEVLIKTPIEKIN